MFGLPGEQGARGRRLTASATVIQAAFRAMHDRRSYLRTRAAVLRIQAGLQVPSCCSSGAWVLPGCCLCCLSIACGLPECCLGAAVLLVQHNTSVHSLYDSAQGVPSASGMADATWLG